MRGLSGNGFLPDLWHKSTSSVWQGTARTRLNTPGQTFVKPLLFYEPVCGRFRALADDYAVPCDAWLRQSVEGVMRCVHVGVGVGLGLGLGVGMLLLCVSS